MERNLSFAYAVTEIPLYVYEMPHFSDSLLQQPESIALFCGWTFNDTFLCFLKSIEPNHSCKAHKICFATIISILYLQQHLSDFLLGD